MKSKITSQAYLKSVVDSPTNNSISKQAHAFSKSPRFPQLRPECPLISYNGDEVKTRRPGAGIGIGKKSDFTRDLTCSPPCSKYQLKTTIQSNISHHRGYSIGGDRDKIKFGSYIDRQKLINPPLNRYKINNSILSNKLPAYSLGSRTKMFDKSRTIQPLNDNPGPGEYYNRGIQRRASSILSGFQNLSFSSSKSERFPSADNRIPGPGRYKQVTNLTKYGNYPITKHKGGLKAKFLDGRRITQFDKAIKKSNEVPGAGAYIIPSQFGNCSQHDQFRLKLQKICIPSVKK